MGLYEDDEEFLDLNEAEEILSQLRKDDPSEYERMAALRDGIRTAKSFTHKGTYVFCEATYKEEADIKGYQQLFLLDKQGEIVSRDIPRILGVLKCGHELTGSALPAGYNATVMRVKQLFAEGVKHRQTEREHSLGLSSGQRYILREMRLLFGVTTSEDTKAQINLLEKAFRGRVTKAINKELNLIRRNGVTGESLLKILANLFHQHNMSSWLDRQGSSISHPIPKIVCSEALGLS